LEEALREVLIDVTVVAVRRAHGRVETPSLGLKLSGGDTLVLSGRPQALSRAEALLLKG
jgi:CPA2 family monovalent cation:H+ antiporter-2